MKSQSSLTRQIFRAITANRPYRIPGCPSRPLAHRRRRDVQSFTTSQGRPMFGLGFGATIQAMSGAKPTVANIEAALARLVVLLNAQRNQTRPPPDEQLVDAFQFFFSARVSTATPLTRTEAYLANETFRHLLSKDRVLSEAQPVGLATQDLQNVLSVLAAPAGTETFRSDYQALAAAVLDVLRQRPDLSPLDAAAASDADGGLRNQFFESYTAVLARTGSASEALTMLRGAHDPARGQSVALWMTVLQGLASEGSTAEFWSALAEMRRRTGPLRARVHEELCTLLARRDDVEGTLKMIADGTVPTTACLAAVLDCAVRNANPRLAGEVAAQLRTRTDLDGHVGTLLKHYATVDPSVQNVTDKIDELEGDGVAALNMATVNSLVAHAYAKRDPALAQSYVDMARSRGLAPDASTCLARLDFALAGLDMDAAAKAFDALSVQDIPKDRSDVPVLNRYISVLARTANPNHDYVVRALDSILETGATLDPDTVASLCQIFLRRDELDEASTLMRHRIDAFPRADRARIVTVFENFVLDPDVPDQRAWNAYDLLRLAFPETPVGRRIGLMESFFGRNRPDLGCLVFGHMRQREELEARPTAEAYARCFHGIAQCKDFDGLQMAYNMLKMDVHVEQTTRVHNALMEAYTACRAPFTSIIDHFWHVLDSPEGPTLNSFALALQACEQWIPQGSQEARKIMAVMQEWSLDITKEIYDCYVGALAGQSEFENTVELIQHMEQDTGLEPDATTIGTFYNAIPFQYRKDAVEAWAKEAYPAQWEELLTFGDVVDEEWEIRYFKIDRGVDWNDDLLFASGEYSPQLARDVTLQIEEPPAQSRA